MRCIVFLSVVLVIPTVAFADTIHVPGDYLTIQEAIVAAEDRDTVLVAPGTHVETIDLLGKAITVKSEQGAFNTIIDGNGSESVVTCRSGEGLDSVVDGFTITNGYATSGGGICIDDYNSCATIKNNIITGNIAANDGGGIYCRNSLITNNTICNNSASFGSGIFTELSSIDRAQFSNWVDL